jgi:hypothetical protein
MRVPELFRTSSFRIAGISGGVFVLGILFLFAFIYWQTAIYQIRATDTFVDREIHALADGKPDELIDALQLDDSVAGQGMAYAGLFAAEGRRIAGNLRRLPPKFPIDGRAHSARIGEAHPVRAAAAMLSDGRILFIARDVSELRQLRHIVLRALVLGVIPAILLALGAGALLSWRELRRVRSVHLAAARILQGKLLERLPTRRTGDDFDRLALSFNRMLDEIARLLDEIKGVGDDIAHDLRTPLTRVRARLERGVEASRGRDELEASIDAAIAGLDQTLGIITALLRIAEIEDGRRRAAFREFDLARILHDVGELYGPIAEDAGIALAVDAAAPCVVRGDRDLMVEAVANVLDNAIKFSPKGGRVKLSLIDRPEGPIVRIVDRGPGIPPQERQSVLKRFYRADKSRHLPGSGLGLGIVSAVMKLHHFRIAIGDAGPGCVFDLICAPLPAAAEAALATSPH